MTVAPSTRRIYAAPVRMTLGFASLCPLAHQRCASSAVRAPRAGALPAASFPRRVTASHLPFGSGFLSSRSPEDLHLHVTSRFAFAFRLTAPVTALRAMPGAHKKMAGIRPAMASVALGPEEAIQFRVTTG